MRIKTAILLQLYTILFPVYLIFNKKQWRHCRGTEGANCLLAVSAAPSPNSAALLQAVKNVCQFFKHREWPLISSSEENFTNFWCRWFCLYYCKQRLLKITLSETYFFIGLALLAILPFFHRFCIDSMPLRVESMQKCRKSHNFTIGEVSGVTIMPSFHHNQD